jgi:hypothetical protein
MKNLLLVVGTVSLLAAPAGAGGMKKSSKRPTVAQVDKTAVLAPVIAPVVAPVLPAASNEMVALPQLPADTSSPLNAFPELDAKVQIASAVKPAKIEKSKPLVMNMGDKYVLGTKRESAKPTQEVEQIIPKSLSQSQVATVVQSHMGEIQQCWNMIPKQLRADACTADLKLEINEAGDVTDIELGGDVPASAQKCMSSAISHWTFPTAETTSDVEYGISLRSL